MIEVNGRTYAKLRAPHGGGLSRWLRSALSQFRQCRGGVRAISRAMMRERLCRACRRGDADLYQPEQRLDRDRRACRRCTASPGTTIWIVRPAKKIMIVDATPDAGHDDPRRDVARRRARRRRHGERQAAQDAGPPHGRRHLFLVGKRRAARPLAENGIDGMSRRWSGVQRRHVQSRSVAVRARCRHQAAASRDRAELLYLSLVRSRSACAWSRRCRGRRLPPCG